MIKFKEKAFIAPLIIGAANAIGTVATVGSMVQSHKQSGEAQEAAEEQERLIKKQNNLLKKQNKDIEKLAEKNPSLAAQVQQQKSYAAINVAGIKALGKNVFNAGKQVFGKDITSNLVTGTAMGVSAYGAGKFIQHKMKKDNLEMNEQGQLAPISQKSYAIPTGSILGNLKKAGSFLNKHKSAVGFGVAMGGAPLALGYLSDRKQMKDQINQTQMPSPMPEQKNFGFNMGSVLSGVKNLGGLAKTQGAKIADQASRAVRKTKVGWRNFKRDPGMHTSSTLLSLGSFGMGNTKKVQGFGDTLIKMGKGEAVAGVQGMKSNAAVKTGEWIKNHKTASNLIAAAPLIPLAGATYDGPGKIANKVGHAVDPNAYAYSDAKNKQTEQ